MKSIKSAIIIGLVSLSSLLAQQIIIHAGSLLNGTSKKAVSKRSIIVENGKIVDVVRGYKKGGEMDTVIDLKDATVTVSYTHLTLPTIYSV